MSSRLLRRLSGFAAPALFALGALGLTAAADPAQRAAGAASLLALPHDAGAPRAVLPAPEQGAPQGARRDTTTFRHDRHASLECVACHQSGRRTGGVINATARNCAGCHHADTELGRSCARCHEGAEMSTRRMVATSVEMSVWPAPRTRQLGFEHPNHEKFACAECHAANRERTLLKNCASCHAEHHEATRNCGSCHRGVEDLHDRGLHVTGCGTSGCHVRETTAAVTPARAVCVACHRGQASHMRGRECATCHLSQWRVAASGGGR